MGHKLLDSGALLRLDDFAGIRVARPCPSATWSPVRQPHEWKPHLRFEPAAGGSGSWSGALDGRAAEAWALRTEAGFELGLWPGPNGQVGAFPEQHANWRWLRATCAASPRPLRVLNLFAYTGGSTLACAAAGNAEVTHIDGSRAALARARDNAARSGLARAPIRWIAEDVTTFVERAARRGESFDGVILDPPAFGRGGAKKREWRIERDLPPLLGSLRILLGSDPAFMLLSAHDPRWPTERLEEHIDALGFHQVDTTSGVMMLSPGSGNPLPMGCFCRFANPRLGTWNDEY
ncbi:hypothetical protein AB1Y20_007509 [Prymnesium parvum]|uniref:S-adenosylmethionine-dependent methyltransferase domain-containing protein n=1 Tax=Prymnesium parvum TaxID=97485 RepID=A0AB34IY38_PRYPA